MLTQVRSSLTRAPASTTICLRALTRRFYKTSNVESDDDDLISSHKEIEEKTLQILQKTVNKDKYKPIAESSQRFQKNFRAGDTYHPDDLNDSRYQEQLRQRRTKVITPAEDPFEVLGLDPLVEYKNYRLLANFVSSMGKILPREQTGVSAKNQRKLAKAIKRARAMGLMSSTNNRYDFQV
ncbi:ribosomal protein S18 [Cokeromyces recurvatus]|uniref:ribosomal protein S18 n=1 Tax=Cokeromyces recurvatus TaxID=90255 RepID=UPI00221F40CE|nr:ribosomal protein S18 [Cokeromyces recurvatus]KAI7898199.1 ribosomal protein S18 [Cokeromyces recurvatus]